MMKVTQATVESSTQDFIAILGENYPWQWEPRLAMYLSEFASNKQSFALIQLQTYFDHQWDHKTIKKIPKELKQQLAQLAKLKPGQQVFIREGNESTPPLLALWWPWGHGGTISLRLTILPKNYQYQDAKPQPDGFMSIVKKLFS